MVITYAIFNYASTLLVAYFICWQFVSINKVKKLIISHTHIAASCNQIIIAMSLYIDETNILVNPEYIYNKYVTQRQKQLGLLMLV